MGSNGPEPATIGFEDRPALGEPRPAQALHGAIGYRAASHPSSRARGAIAYGTRIAPGTGWRAAATSRVSLDFFFFFFFVFLDAQIDQAGERKKSWQPCGSLSWLRQFLYGISTATIFALHGILRHVHRGRRPSKYSAIAVNLSSSHRNRRMRCSRRARRPTRNTSSLVIPRVRPGSPSSRKIQR